MRLLKTKQNYRLKCILGCQHNETQRSFVAKLVLLIVLLMRIVYKFLSSFYTTWDAILACAQQLTYTCKVSLISRRNQQLKSGKEELKTIGSSSHFNILACMTNGIFVDRFDARTIRNSESVWCMLFDDRFSRLDTIPARDRQADGQNRRSCYK